MTLWSDKPSFEPIAVAPELSPTLPSWIYRDPDVLAHERERVFGRTWAFVGHVSDVPEHGAITRPIDDVSVTLSRDDSGALTAGLADPTSGGSAPRVEVLASLVFVNLDPEAESLAAQAPELEASIRGFVPAIDRLVKCHETLHDVDSNWKVLVENSLECYHCEPCHPGFATRVDMDRYRSFSDGIVTIHTSRRAGAAAGSTGEATVADPENGFMYWYVWPTTEIDATPGPRPHLAVLTRKTLGPNRHRLIYHYYQLPGDTLSAEEKQSLQDDVTLMEDIAICEAVQRGLGSFGYSQGRFIVDQERSHISEHSVHHFQRLVADALGLDHDP